MGNEQSYFIVPVTSGLCIEPNRSYYNLPYTKVPDIKNLNQQWILERQGPKVAFRNASGKDYLCAMGKTNEAQVRTQSSPHWWTMEPGRTAGSFWIKSEDIGGYLCNPYGRHSEGNMQWMWSIKDPAHTQRLLFYLQSTQSLNGSPDLMLSAGAAVAGSPEEAQAKEKEEQEKQKQLEEYEAKKKELAEQEKAVEAKEKEVAEKQKEIQVKQREFEAQQKAATEKQSKLEEREKKIAAKETASPGKGAKGSRDAQSQVQQLQSQLAEANKALEEARKNEEHSSADARDLPESQAQAEQLQSQLAEANRALAAAKKREESAAAGDSAAKEAELARAQKQIAQLQAELRDMNSSSRARGSSLGEGSDPSSDNRWRSTAPLAAGVRRKKPPGMKTEHDYENDPRWKLGAPGEERPRKQIPDIKTGGDYENDPRWTANAPAAAKLKQSDPRLRQSDPRLKQSAPEGMRTGVRPLPRLRAP